MMSLAVQTAVGQPVSAIETQTVTNNSNLESSVMAITEYSELLW